MSLGWCRKCSFSVNFCAVEYSVFATSLKSLCWQRRILMLEIDLTLVLKALSDVGKMHSMATNLIGVHVGILKFSKNVSVANCICENYGWRRS